MFAVALYGGGGEITSRDHYVSLFAIDSSGGAATLVFFVVDSAGGAGALEAAVVQRTMWCSGAMHHVVQRELFS